MYDHLAQTFLISGVAVGDLHQSSMEELFSPLDGRPLVFFYRTSSGNREIYKEFTRIACDIIPSTFQCWRFHQGGFMKCPSIRPVLLSGTLWTTYRAEDQAVCCMMAQTFHAPPEVHTGSQFYGSPLIFNQKTRWPEQLQSGRPDQTMTNENTRMSSRTWESSLPLSHFPNSSAIQSIT